MTLEQRLAAVEAELEEMKVQQKDYKDIAALVKKTITETIKKERRPGGCLYQSGRVENAAISQAATTTFYSGRFYVQSAKISDGIITSGKL
ncbi:hypothetical protein HRD68_16875 [Yersinia massiliensis]|uniref:hypothetical protein n=1 Tax=Yersinia massiliensis TaxID=419257 RepID=UPI001562E84E|nr:hypothetical protein [Yersinia massiliensis]QKJ12257.1 hypothetical protein HRD68_16875 [Yersinia massiliensis]